MASLKKSKILKKKVIGEAFEKFEKKKLLEMEKILRIEIFEINELKKLT